MQREDKNKSEIKTPTKNMTYVNKIKLIAVSKGWH